MKTLLQINTVVNYGSTGHIVEDIGRMAIEKGWKSYIAYGRNNRISESELIRVGTSLDVKLHGLQTRLFDRHGLGSVRSTKSLVKQIDILKPDIIHLHNLHGYYLNIEILFNYLKNSQIPVVWTLHDCWSLTGHCSHFSMIGCNKWKTVCSFCPQTSEYPSSLLFDRSYKNFLQKKKIFSSIKNLKIVTVSSWLKDIVENSYLAKYDTNVIYNGVDVEVFSPQINIKELKQKYDIDNKFVLIGVATDWSKPKGINDYIKLIEYLPLDCVVIMVGLTPDIIRSLPNRIIGLPRTENLIELAQLYSVADVVLNLSYQESFGLTTVEGFACGVPGIVYNCTASPELIDRNTGFVIEPGDFAGIVNAVRIIKKNGKPHYSDNCRKLAINLYNKDDRYNEYIELYKNMLI
jgi:putative colanic acid biosynthesis glycosyltransferase